LSLYLPNQPMLRRIFITNDMHRRNQPNELRIANKALAFQNKEKDKRAAELIIANKELVFQNEEKRNRAAELVVANKELAYQNTEKENRAAELIIANKELAFQNEEKENRAAELIIANKELLYQNEEREDRAAELIVANKELLYQNEEKECRAIELTIAYKELSEAEDNLKGYIKGLEEMMFITSHKVRQPVANILGIASILDDCINSPAQIKKLTGYLKTSALSLDAFTKELTSFITDLDEKGKTRFLPED